MSSLISKVGGAAIGLVGAAIAGASAPVTAGAILLGTALGASDHDEANSAARREGEAHGFKNGVRKGEAEANKKFADMHR